MSNVQIFLCLSVAVIMLLVQHRKLIRTERRAEAAEEDMKALSKDANKAKDYLKLSRQAWIQINERDETIVELRKTLQQKNVILEHYRKQIEDGR